MACILETNQGLLITALLEAGVPVYPVNPKTVDRRRNAAGAKTDAIEAYLLVEEFIFSSGGSWCPPIRLFGRCAPAGVFHPSCSAVRILPAQTIDIEGLA